MKVLVACEESQRVCMAFRNKGHEAYSADLQECSGGHPEWHIKGDVISLINGNAAFKTSDGTHRVIDSEWDLLIAHPPCTYLTVMGARHIWLSDVVPNTERFEKMREAAKFFMKFYNANCKKICVENPLPFSFANLPCYTQIINPYLFGEPYCKRTCLWLRGLPALVPTNIIPKEKRIPCMQSKWYNEGKSDNERARLRSKTFVGIANAMAEQWG